MTHEISPPANINAPLSHLADPDLDVRAGGTGSDRTVGSERPPSAETEAAPQVKAGSDIVVKGKKILEN